MPNLVELERGQYSPHLRLAYVLAGLKRRIYAGRKEIRIMAKDGTNRGGKRIGAGRKPKPLAEKLQEGKKATALDIPPPAELEGAEVPDIKEFLSQEQRMGELYGKEIYEQMWDWLVKRGCAHLVSLHLLEQYSMCFGRWVQCENLVSSTGMLGRHPTTGNAIASPLVTIAQAYLKEANLLFQQIFSIVSENCREPVTGNPQDEMMEQLLKL